MGIVEILYQGVFPTKGELYSLDFRHNYPKEAFNETDKESLLFYNL